MEQRLIPSSVQRKRTEEVKRRESEKSRMQHSWVFRDTQNTKQSNNAFQDTYMTNALKKVRQSDVTHSDEVTRLHGTWMHNQSLSK
mgnify:CR=1 FL=1